MFLFADDTKPTEPKHLEMWESVLWVLFGILLSLILPLAVRVLRAAAQRAGRLESTERTGAVGRFFAEVWARYAGVGGYYLGIVAAGTVVAIVAVFLLGLEFQKPREAVLAGFAWESLIFKLIASQQTPNDPKNGGGSPAPKTTAPAPPAVPVV